MVIKLIVGLGNIGLEYEGTRHNLGFNAIELFAAASNIVLQAKDKFKATVGEATLNRHKVLLVKPSTFYNASGDAVRALKSFYKLKNGSILVIHDELALPFGTIRTRPDGSDAGNNGIKSIVAAIGEDFARIRIGSANEHLIKQDPADFVLGQFTQAERQLLPKVQTEVQKLINSFIETGKLTPTSVKIKAE